MAEGVGKLSISKMLLVRAVFFCVSVCLVIPLVFGSASSWGIICSLVVIAVSGWTMFRDRDEARPAVSYAATLLAMQFFVRVAVNLDVLASSLNANGSTGFSEAFGGLNRADLLFLLLLGLAICSYGAAYKKIPAWIVSLGGGIVGISFALGRWTEGELTSPKYAKGGGALIAASLILLLLWVVAVYVACDMTPGQQDPKVAASRRSKCLRLGAGMLIAYFVAYVCCSDDMTAVAMDLQATLIGLPEEGFAWWRVTLTCVLLVALAQLAHDEEKADATGWADENYLYVCVALVFGVRVLMSCYFVHSWVLYVAFLVIALRSLRQSISTGQTFFGLGQKTFLVVECLLFTFLSMMLSCGLWTNALVTIAGFVFLRYKVFQTDSARWTAIVAFIVAEALARMATWRLSIDGCVILCLVFAMAVVAIRLLGMKHPSGKTVAPVYYAVIVACVSLLCLASLRSPIHVKATTEGKAVVISTKVDGEENKLKTSFAWKDAFGRPLAQKDGKLEKADTKIDIEGEILSVTSTDRNGVRCTRDFYYAPWLR